MRKTQRIAAVGALAALTFSIAACSSGESASTGSATTTAASGGSSSSAAAAPSSSAKSSSSSASSGVTTVSDIFGPACSGVPASGPGSAGAMVEQPVGTAASTNPLLKTLTAAVTQAGLVDTLNKSDAAYTVFAPSDDAFAAVPKDSLDALLADKAMLTKVLTYHVIPQRYDAAGLVKAGSVTSVEGQAVTIAGTADAPTINGNAVGCGNIPTANATVFVIGSVLMPPA